MILLLRFWLAGTADALYLVADAADWLQRRLM